MSVAWILQIRFLSGIVMKEQTSTHSQNNSHSVYYWTAKGSNRQKQPLAGQAVTFREPQLPPPPAVQWHTVMEKKLPFARCGLVADFMFCLWACLISMHWGLNSQCSDVLLAQRNSETLCISDSTSLDVAVVVRAIRLRHIHLPHGVTHVVHPVPARWHALVDAI